MTPSLSTQEVAVVAPAPAAGPARHRLALLLICAVIAVGMFLGIGLFMHAPRSSATRPPPPDKSIAVLPFVDMSEKKDQEYFADGMTEEILDLLAKIPALKVIGRTSSFQFKGRNENLRGIATKLGAAFVLEGSVRRSGDRVRVAAQLIDARVGTHRWSGTYDRDVDDVLKMQDDIAAGLVRALQITVGAENLQSRSTLANSDAYNLYLHGRYALERFDKEGFDEAARYFQQALILDPKFADALGWLSFTYDSQGEWAFVAPGIAFEKARIAAEAALKLDPKLAIAHGILGAVHAVYDWDWVAADRELKQALALAPSDELALWGNARLSLVVGHWDEALTQINAGVSQNPVTAYYFQALDWIQTRRDHLPEAEAAARRTLEISPTYATAHYYLGLVLLARGEREAALAAMKQETTEGAQLAGLAMAYYVLARKPESDAALTRMVHEQSDLLAFEIAEAFAFRGEADEALRWLERAYAQKDSGLLYIKGDLALKNLEGDPRYKALQLRMNLPE